MSKKNKNEAEKTAVATMEDAAPSPSKKERRAAKEAAKLAEKSAAKAAEKAAKEATRAEKETAKAARKAAKQAEKDAKPPVFKHLRKKKLSSGKGATPREVGESLVALFNAGRAEEAERTWYHRKIESIEADGSVFEGLKGVAEKSAWWTSQNTIVSAKAEGPFVCSTGFTVIFSMTVETKDGKRAEMRESGVYTVENGRIVREQFMY